MSVQNGKISPLDKIQKYVNNVNIGKRLREVLFPEAALNSLFGKYERYYYQQDKK